MVRDAREVVATLDLKSLELVKGSFVDPQLREYHSDLLYRLRLKDGEMALAYVLLEHKRHPKQSTPLQLLGYIVHIWQQAVEQSKGSGRVPPVIPVVVYHRCGAATCCRPRRPIEDLCL